MVDTGLVEKECFAQVAGISGLVCQSIHEVGIVQINPVHLAQSPDATGDVAQLGDETGLFQVEEIIGQAVPADQVLSGQLLQEIRTVPVPLAVSELLADR